MTFEMVQSASVRGMAENRSQHSPSVSSDADLQLRATILCAAGPSKSPETGPSLCSVSSEVSPCFTGRWMWGAGLGRRSHATAFDLLLDVVGYRGHFRFRHALLPYPSPISEITNRKSSCLTRCFSGLCHATRVAFKRD